MVWNSVEVGAQTEARLRGVFRRCTIDWLPGSWSFAEGAEVSAPGEVLAEIRDEGRLSALRLARSGPAERFAVFRIVLPPGEDDSGFVGWLASRVKAQTGSGVFVICGHDRERGGVFDYYGVPEAAAGQVAELLRRLSTTNALDGLVLRVTQAAANARIGPETVFCFDQTGPRVTARYGGGAVTEGWLAGTIDPDSDTLTFDYLQIEADGAVDSGHSTAELDRLPDGRWALTERFTWASRDGGGTNRLEEHRT